ncbi:enoyl-CoA hydratase/isomerase family protein [Thalassobacillus hwangdonensis]|uniref:Enoyl-CoA hydratase/isomerase family protein n=1 Tax=Thalassobacillus hwangdonensis TaxID=546108 RepID=A0ABW3KVZ8_9BACI
MDFSTITYEMNEIGLLTITLNRPEKMNAVSKGMVKELKEAFEQAKQEENLKCLVLTGAGERAFCSGGDLHDFHGEMSAGEAFQMLYPMKEVVYQLASFPLPTIALLNGQARGGGCEIATACDFRYAVNGSSFGFIQGKLGIAPGWGGGALLYEKIRPELAFKWLAESTMYTTEKAFQVGWVHEVIESSQMNEAALLLKDLLNKSITQLRAWKHQYNQRLSILSLSSMMDEEVRVCSKLWESEEHKRAVRTFMENRKEK